MLTAVQFVNCTAAFAGGGAALQSTLADWANVVVRHCQAFVAGGVWTSEGSLQLTETMVTDCVAVNGAGFWATRSQMSIVNSTFRRCINDQGSKWADPGVLYGLGGAGGMSKAFAVRSPGPPCAKQRAIDDHVPSLGPLALGPSPRRLVLLSPCSGTAPTRARYTDTVSLPDA